MKRKVFAVGFVVVMLVALLYSTVYAAATDVFLNKGSSVATSATISGNATAYFWLNCKSDSEVSVSATAFYSTGGRWFSGGKKALSPGQSQGGIKATADGSPAHWKLQLTPAWGNKGSAAGTITSG